MALSTKHQILAWDLVEELGDEKHKGIYFRLAKIYDESFLRGILSLVKDMVRRGKIKSEDSGKYFMGILKKEASSFVAKAMEDKKIYVKNVKNSPRRQSGFKKKNRIGKRSQKS